MKTSWYYIEKAIAVLEFLLGMGVFYALSTLYPHYFPELTISRAEIPVVTLLLYYRHLLLMAGLPLLAGITLLLGTVTGWVTSLAATLLLAVAALRTISSLDRYIPPGTVVPYGLAALAAVLMACFVMLLQKPYLEKYASGKRVRYIAFALITLLFIDLVLH